MMKSEKHAYKELEIDDFSPLPNGKFHQIGKIFHGYFQIYCSHSNFESGPYFNLSNIDEDKFSVVNHKI